MAFTLFLSNTPDAINAFDDRYKRLLSATIVLPTRHRWVFPGGVICIESTPEIELAYFNDDASKGPVGLVVICGHLLHHAEGKSVAIASCELAQYFLAHWEKRDTTFLKELTGSYSLLVVSGKDGRILSSMDAPGTRAIWHSDERERGLILGSRLLAVAGVMPTRPARDKAWIWSFLYNSRTISNHSPFEPIKGLRGGEFLTCVPRGNYEKNLFFEPYVRPDYSRSLTETADALNESLRENMYEACLGTKRPTIFLSGGLDSRLIAGLAPPEVSAVTFGEQPNRESKIAEKVARKLNIPWDFISRDKDWYPSSRERTILRDGCLYSWINSHFAGLEYHRSSFPYDAAILGYASDTYFKGLYLENNLLWKDWKERSGPEPTESEFLDLATDPRSLLAGDCNKMLVTPFFEECREAFRAAVAEEFSFASRYASTLPDIWEIYSIGTLLRVKAFANLTCLRDITSERNAFCSSRLLKLYLTIPCGMRRGNELVKMAVRRCGKGLDWIPDSNTWLPTRFPNYMHKMSARARLRLASFRAKRLSRQASTDISGSGSWVRSDRLIVVDQGLQQEIDGMFEDMGCFPSSRYDLTSLEENWTKHKATTNRSARQFYNIQTYWILEQTLKKLW